MIGMMSRGHKEGNYRLTQMDEKVLQRISQSIRMLVGNQANAKELYSLQKML